MQIKLIKHSFYKKEKKTFKTGKLDIMVTFLVLTVFIIAFFFLSFKALTIDGEIIYSERYWHETGDPRIPTINDFAILGPLIMVYEAFLLTLEGKKRGRYISWELYYQLFRYKIYLKIEEGKQQTNEFLKKH